MILIHDLYLIDWQDDLYLIDWQVNDNKSKITEINKSNKSFTSKDQMILFTSKPGGGKLNIRSYLLKLILNKNIITCPGLISNSILLAS